MIWEDNNKMIWRSFWVSVVVLIVSWRVRKYNEFAGIEIVSPLKEVILVLFLASFVFCAYFILNKLGLIDRLNELLEDIGLLK